MNPLGILSLALAVVILGVGIWLIMGVTILLNRCVYPERIPPQKSRVMPSAEFIDVRFPSAGDGALLSGWFVPARVERPKGAILFCHGMSQNRDQMLPWAEPLWQDGFHVLLFDFRAVGESEGERATGGYMETQDVLGAVNYLTSRPDCAGLAIGAMGFSMGGSSAILAAAEDPRIRAVATHAAYATLDGAIEQRCRYHFGPFGPIVDWGFRMAGRSHFHVPPGEIVPLNVVACLSPRALLLLHGEKDPIILPHHAQDLYAAAGEPKELRFLPDTDHDIIPEEHMEVAKAHVVSFFRKNLSA